jgi:chromate transporter
MFVGFAAGGIPGVFTALLGSILPPTVLMLIVASVLQYFQQETWLQGFVKGMSPAVAALIVMVSWELFRAGSKRSISSRTMLIAALSGLALWLEVPSPLVLLGAGILGVILFR